MRFAVEIEFCVCCVGRKYSQIDEIGLIFCYPGGQFVRSTSNRLAVSLEDCLFPLELSFHVCHFDEQLTRLDAEVFDAFEGAIIQGHVGRLWRA